MTTTPTTNPNALEAAIEKLHLGQTLANTPWAGWVMLLVSIFLGLLIGKFSAIALRYVAERWDHNGWKTRATFVRAAAGPAYVIIFTFLLGLGLTGTFITGLGHLRGIELAPEVRAFALKILKFLYIFAIAWFCYNMVDLLDVALRRWASRTKSHLDDQIVPLVRKAIRIFVIVLFVLFTAENVFGADITAWLAGLGIAGLAVSLAAQDSIKNLFGSFTILLDRPFSVGERVTIDQADGTVEEIGFRSTKIRTLDGMVVTIPNSKVVDSAVRNVARRPHIRRMMNITITYDTPADKIEQAVQIIKDILAHPDIAKNLDTGKFTPRVAFDEFNADSLNIKVFYWFVPPDYWQYIEHAQRFNLMLFRAFEQADIDFAFPTQTIHLANDAKRQLRIEGVERFSPPDSQ